MFIVHRDATLHWAAVSVVDPNAPVNVLRGSRANRVDSLSSCRVLTDILDQLKALSPVAHNFFQSKRVSKKARQRTYNVDGQALYESFAEISSASFL